MTEMSGVGSDIDHFEGLPTGWRIWQMVAPASQTSGQMGAEAQVQHQRERHYAFGPDGSGPQGLDQRRSSLRRLTADGVSLTQRLPGVGTCFPPPRRWKTSRWRCEGPLNDLLQFQVETHPLLARLGSRVPAKMRPHVLNFQERQTQQDHPHEIIMVHEVLQGFVEETRALECAPPEKRGRLDHERYPAQYAAWHKVPRGHSLQEPALGINVVAVGIG